MTDLRLRELDRLAKAGDLAAQERLAHMARRELLVHVGFRIRRLPDGTRIVVMLQEDNGNPHRKPLEELFFFHVVTEDRWEFFDMDIPPGDYFLRARNGGPPSMRTMDFKFTVHAWDDEHYYDHLLPEPDDGDPWWRRKWNKGG